MPINSNDDYKLIADFLYPSIEASGNVYYGQTKKLTMDEILGKNKLNFESHIESVRVNDSTADYGFKYESYFCWKLGPLKGSIKIIPSVSDSSANTFPDVSSIVLRENFLGEKKDTEINSSVSGIAYACYRLSLNQHKIENNIYSGTYNIYENDPSLEFINVCVISDDINPANINEHVTNINDRNFFFNSTTKELYVKICSGVINYNYINTNNEDDYVWPENDNRFKIKAVDGDVLVSYSLHGENSEFNESYRLWYKRYNDGDEYTELLPSELILIHSGESVKFKRSLINTEDKNIFPMYDENNDIVLLPQLTTDSGYSIIEDEDIFDDNLVYAQFHMTSSSDSAHVQLMGNIGDLKNHTDYATYACLFKDCSLITDVDCRDTVAWNNNSYYAYYKTFAGCTNLRKATISTNSLYNKMLIKTFAGCASLSNMRFIAGSVENYNTSEPDNDIFLNCQSDVTYTIGSYYEYYHRDLGYYDFDEDIYNVVKLLVPDSWNLDNGWLLFTYSGEDGDSATIDISNTITWKDVDTGNQIESKTVIEFMDPQSGEWINGEDHIEINNNLPKVFFRVNPWYKYESRNEEDFSIKVTKSGGQVKVYGSPLSILGHSSAVENIPKFAFSHLFEECDITRGPNLIVIFQDNSATYAFESMYKDCTNLTEFPEIRVIGLCDYAFHNTFSQCTSLESISKMSDWVFKEAELDDSLFVRGTNVFNSMFCGCTSLKSVPELVLGNSNSSSINYFLDNTLPVGTYSDTFSGCTSLTTFKTTGINNNENYGSIFNIESGNCCTCIVYTDGENKQRLEKLIPDSWSFDGENKFNCKLLQPDGHHNEFKSGILITSGTESDRNGRGKVTEKSTESSVLNYNPVLSDNPPKMDAYDPSNGQYNQDIWGIKCFNSPVAFRNGIYTDTSVISSTEIILHADNNSEEFPIRCNSNVQFNKNVRLLGGVYLDSTNDRSIEILRDGTTGKINHASLKIPVIPKLPDQPDNENTSVDLPLGSITFIYVEAANIQNKKSKPNLIGKRYHADDSSYTLYCNENRSYTEDIFLAKFNDEGVLTKGDRTNGYFVGLTDGKERVINNGDGFFVLAMVVYYTDV